MGGLSAHSREVAVSLHLWLPQNHTVMIVIFVSDGHSDSDKMELAGARALWNTFRISFATSSDIMTFPTSF